MIDTILDFSKWLTNKNIYFDYLMILQPTSPLRTYNDINKVKNILKIINLKVYLVYPVHRASI